MFWVYCQNAPKTVDAFIPVFAGQIKNYNKIAPSLWPDNKVVNLSELVQSIEHNKAWLISPVGEMRTLSSKEVKELSPTRPRYNIGFAPFKNDTMQGVYLALSEEALKNVLEFERYQYLGTYDLLLTYNHEMFHQLEQDQTWASPDSIQNRGRSPRYDDAEARTERHLIYQLLLQAYAANTSAQRDSLLLQLLANYEQYKNKNKTDFVSAKYFDRIEGTAHYYEVVSSLYSAYPDQIYSSATLRNGLKTFAKSSNPKPYDAPGLDNESYVIGVWTGFLLDELQEDNSKWKIEIMKNPELTPMEILNTMYSNNSLPAPVPPTKAMEDEVRSSIEKARNKKVAPGIFRMLYQLIF